jgi:hypothetical protein
MPLCTILDAVGAQRNCSAIVEGLMFGWQNSFDEHWFDFANLGIQFQSFHDSAASAQIDNTTSTTTDPTVLTPVY